jgi:1-deoxy-D-xylulose-5-phosphate reductoisomerase
LDLASVSPLTFAPVDEVSFPCAKLGHEVLAKHPLVATVLNAANDVAVDYFLQGKITFLSIYSTVRYIIDFYEEEVQAMDYSLEAIKNLDAVVRKYTKSYLENLIV